MFYTYKSRYDSFILQESGGQGSSDEVKQDLGKKVVALTCALNTLSSEKKRTELSFQNDKKRLLGEKEKVCMNSYTELLVLISLIIDPPSLKPY